MAQLIHKNELKSLLALAAPIAAMQTGLLLYNLVDTLFMGRVSALALAGVGLGSATYAALYLLGMGFLLGVDTLSARAFGARRPEECARVLTHAAALALAAALPLIWLLGRSGAYFALLGVDPAVAAVAQEYLGVFRWMAAPALLFVAARQYLQSMDVTRPQLWAIAGGNLLNVALNRVLIFGAFGIPPMGVRGCALASVCAGSFMLAVVWLAAARRMRADGWRPGGFDPRLFAELVRLGAPAGLQMFVEVSAFSLAHALMARFGTVVAAAHQITMNLAALTFMVPLGVSFAAAVRVGQGLGRGQPVAALRAGDSALVSGVAFMSATCALFLALPEPILRLYTGDAAVVASGIGLLTVAAFFQVFDGAQVVLTGALRGLGETRLPFAANLVGHGLCGLPLGWWLAFRAGAGPRGLWIGLLAGLATVAGLLYLVWRARSRALLGVRQPSPALPVTA